MLTLLAGSGLLVTLAGLAVWDWRTGQLPDTVTLPLLLAGLALAAGTGGWDALITRLAGSAAGAFGLAAVAWSYQWRARRPGLGGGDIKLLAAIGAWIGWQPLPAVVALAAAGTLLLVLLGAVWRRRPVQGMQAVPFGPGLAAAGGLAWLTGQHDLETVSAVISAVPFLPVLFGH